ncbi:aminopeptidase [Sphingomonas sp. Leaf412]|uniref:leucyl aminopeptidase family protein n=1 Tax=Sphingomonas sp. Leaf412 TaxID=1736370 RepID=UPI0006F77F99|nr:leucyl aminopeptidase family protein [Sphingomonas sp. Leaf412]KQT32246.1 aminopeptidase [Sphingomonas sp. Leaf412]
MIDFSTLLAPDRGQPARDIHVVHPDAFGDWLARQPPRIRTAVAANRVSGKAGNRAVLPGEGAEDWSMLLVCDEDAASPWRIASLGDGLPEGTYRLAGGEPGAAMLGWCLAQHRFTRYKATEPVGARVLLTGEPARIEEVVRLAHATALVRTLVDTAAADMGPAELEAEADRLALAHDAKVTVTRGDALATGYPMIHAVGQAATRERGPRLIELEWGDPAHPRIAIVGKGVCFDTGGLDLKPSAGMRLMKKDMGGAAHALALAGLVMAARLKVRLHLLIPAVENAVSAAAFRPGDVLATRLGLTVENTNTDAEGRLVLGDALTKAVEGAPDLILDFATLTGAARVALGPDLPATFANDEALAAELLAAGDAVRDPLWRLPLWDGYDDMLKSDVADMVNAPDGGFAGAITAALFLRRFVPAGIPWAHLDTFAWRPVGKPGRPKGGDAYGLRATWALLKGRFS